MWKQKLRKREAIAKNEPFNEKQLTIKKRLGKKVENVDKIYKTYEKD